jgi:hypothetical protein
MVGVESLDSTVSFEAGALWAECELTTSGLDVVESFKIPADS